MVSAAVCAALLLTACDKQASSPAAAANAAPQERPVSVAVVSAVTKAVEVRQEISGRTVAYRVAEVRPQVNGVLQKRLFTEGAMVKEGQPLYQIDASTYNAAEASAQAALAQAEAQWALAKADAARSAELVKVNAVSRQSDDTVQARVKTADAAVKAAKAALTNARINVRYTSVRAPISGRVSISEVTPGALMTAYQQQRMTVIHQLDPIYVDVQQTNTQLLKLRSDIASGRIQSSADGSATVKIRLEDGSEYPLPGKLTFSGVSVAEDSGTVTLRAVFPNPKGLLLPGMYVRAMLPSGDIPNAVLITQRAVMRDMKGNPYVYTVNKDNRVERRDIQTGEAIGGEWVVDSGLSSEDKGIVEGLDKVRPGVLVATSAPTPPTHQQPAASSSKQAAASGSASAAK